MKSFCFCMILLLLTDSDINAQKAPVTNESYKSWTTLYDYHISDDGNYVLYRYGSEPGKDTTILQSVNGQYKKIMASVSDAKFIDGGTYVLFTIDKGIGLLNTGGKEMRCIDSAFDARYYSIRGAKWLFYLKGGSLIQEELYSQKKLSYNSARRYWLSESGNVLVYMSDNSINRVDLVTEKSNVIYKGKLPDDISIDNNGQQLAFLHKKGDEYSVYYYKAGMDTAVPKIINSSAGIKATYYIGNEPPRFTKDGKTILFRLGQRPVPLDSDTVVIATNVDVWSYQDVYLQSNQAYTTSGRKNRKFSAAFNLSQNILFQIEDEDTILASFINKQYALLRPADHSADIYQRAGLGDPYDVISLRDGTRKTVAVNKINLALSPDEQYIYWFDTTDKHYHTYELATGIRRNISRDISAPLESGDNISNASGPIGTAGWLKDDIALLIYSQYDIWQVDPSGKKQAINLTGGYGAKHHVLLRAGIGEEELKRTGLNDPIPVAGLDEDSKRNGFFMIRTGRENQLVYRELDNCLYYFPNLFVDHPAAPIKAAKANTYLLTMQDASAAPNLVVSHDLKVFRQLSGIVPQAGYNWMKATIHHWLSPDGKKATGILYQPEDFDSSRTYPVIYNFYESRSNELHRFWSPTLSNGQLSIPWYVSNGYLVFVPDISFRTGKLSEDVTAIINSSVDYLQKYKWVDIRRMGVQGHSFAGYVTNLLASQTNLFAAAQSTAGLSDMIVEYAGLGFGGKSLIEMTEQGQLKMGNAPWETPEVYKANSIIYTLDKSSTPLLLAHNKEDGIVPFAHSLLLFNALRRLNKPVWMLQYDGEGHILDAETTRLDYAIRQQQFFNYYLKGGPLPFWMKKSMPYSYKGLRSGLSTR